MNNISAIKCVILLTVFTTWALEEIPAPNLSKDEKYIQPWPSLEQQQHHHVQDPDPVLRRTPRTLQQHVTSQRKMDEQFGLFLPGLGIVKDYVPAQREPQGPHKRCSTYIQ